MTEEFKQKAEKSAEKFFGKPTDLVDLDNLRIFKNGYLIGVEEVKADCDFALEGKDVEIKELKDKLNNWVKCAELRLANWQKYETENNRLLDVINNQDIKIADLEKKVEEQQKYQNHRRCINCEHLNRNNGNCLVVGGFYSSVADKDCPKIKEKIELYKQLEQARNIIRDLISISIDWIQEGDKDYSYIEDAKQFIGEENGQSK